MLRKICVGMAALLLAGSLAMGGEGLGLKVEVGIDIGSIDDEVGGALFQPRVVVSDYGEEFNWDLRFRAFFTTEGDEDVESDGWDVRGQAGWGFKLADDWTLSLLGGLSYRTFSMGVDDTPIGDVEMDIDALVLDLGARVTGKLNDQLDLVGQLSVGPVLSGDAEIELGALSADDDLDGGVVIEFRAGVDWRVSDALTVYLGGIYESVDVDFEEGGSMDYYKVAFQMAVSFKF